jgi:hypothetical protein
MDLFWRFEIEPMLQRESFALRVTKPVLAFGPFKSHIHKNSKAGMGNEVTTFQPAKRVEIVESDSWVGQCECGYCSSGQ